MEVIIVFFSIRIIRYLHLKYPYKQYNFYSAGFAAPMNCGIQKFYRQSSRLKWSVCFFIIEKRICVPAKYGSCATVTTLWARSVCGPLKGADLFITRGCSSLQAVFGSVWFTHQSKRSDSIFTFFWQFIEKSFSSSASVVFKFKSRDCR